MKLRPAQKNKLSEFFNTIAAAWFTIGVISPLFIQSGNINKTIILGGVSLLLTSIFVYWSLSLVEKIKL
jgi:hypothetical protein